jgi:hypothetical protein
MTRHYFFLAIAISSLLVAGCAHLDSADKLPKNSEYVPAPMFDEFDSAKVTADAKKLLGTKDPVSLLVVNSEADDKDLGKIVTGIADVHSRGEPLVCAGRDSRYVTDALGRALLKYPKVDLSGMTIVVAAPNEPSKDFPEILTNRKIQYHYMHVTPNAPYGQ